MATLKELIAIIKKLNIDVDVTGMKNAELIKEITNAGYDVNGKKVTKKPASKKGGTSTASKPTTTVSKETGKPLKKVGRVTNRTTKGRKLKSVEAPAPAPVYKAPVKKPVIKLPPKAPVKKPVIKLPPVKAPVKKPVIKLPVIKAPVKKPVIVIPKKK
tara:strand:- start:975 stop:1448 length:474 start_codon:yes stop_codon:yes gene_type:complete